MFIYVRWFWIGLTAIWLLLWGGFALESLREHERRAARIAGGLAIMGGLTSVLISQFPLRIQYWIALVVIAFGLVLFILSLLPIGRVPVKVEVPGRRMDERDIMFARYHLEPGSPEWDAYYKMRPEKKAVDDAWRKAPGLMRPGSREYNPFLIASPDASFTLTETMHPMVDGQPAEERHEMPPEEMTAYIKGLAKFYGAKEVGITELKPYHVYTHVGRGPEKWGKPLQVEHKYAIAFTVEMDHEMTMTAPAASISMETAKQYVEVGVVAVQLADVIRRLGYPARAHMESNYQVICPLVARDAGLGEIGRITLLMTPDLGPRVRIAVVTTDLPLVTDAYRPDPAVIDFCNICQKCADTCPSRAIPLGERTEKDGARRWLLDPDKCFRYWNIAGTDCGICMAVCPYSHPDTFFHNLTRWGIQRSGFIRRVALRLDDLFYGRKPERKAPPAWVRVP